MSRVVRVHRLGGPEVLRVDQMTVAAPLSGEVRIAVGAIGLNRVESMFFAGSMGVPKFPSKIGYEAAGVIEALGADVKGFAIGDKVAVLSGLSMEEYGVCADTALYPASMLIKQPANLSVEQSAAAWMQYLTAYAIVGVADLRRDEPIVITAASSSVGLAAIEIANLVGAVPIAVTRGRAKAGALLRHGARHVVVNGEEDLGTRIRALTGGKGARVIFDAVAGDTLNALIDVASPRGCLIVYGTLGGAVSSVVLPPAMLKGLSIRGYAMNEFVSDPENRRKSIEFVNHGLSSGKLRPVIDRVFALEDVAEAYRYLESNEQVGKIILRT